MKATDFSETISNFLNNYLINERGYSRNTVKSYRDTWKLLIVFIKENKNIKVEKLEIKHITMEIVIDFLNHIETYRNCSAKTRNSRLAAIKSYYSYIQYIRIDNLHESQKILSIKSKRTIEKTIEYLSMDAVKVLLQQPDTRYKKGIRDLALLSLLYETGARLQEIIDLTPSMIVLKSPYSINLLGKGNKSRSVPIFKTQINHLKQYMRIYNIDTNEARIRPLFFNKQENHFSSEGIRYILEKYIKMARKQSNIIIPKNISPHSLRHSRAVHLLSLGVPLYIIRDFLGHNSIVSTELYAKVETKQKREAIEKVNQNVSPENEAKWLNNPQLLSWLSKL